MNPHAAHPTSPIAMLRSFWINRNLIFQLTKREVIGRYKGSLFGLAWSFFNPLFMLAIYTFVFSVVFKARWGINTDENKTKFALVLFVGLILHTLLAEVLNRAPGQVLGNTNYVKKVIFPLETLPIVNLFAALFHALISFTVLLIVFVLLAGLPNWTALLTPLTIMPLVPLILGLAWMLTALGVYVRDISQFIGLVTMALMFLAPIFYPITALPKAYQSILRFNPLTLPIEQTRAVLMFGELPDWGALGVYSVISIILCWIGYVWFQRTRKGFADVL